MASTTANTRIKRSVMVRAPLAALSLIGIPSLIAVASETATRPYDANCTFIQGFSFPQSVPISNGHLSATKTVAGCCGACEAEKQCQTWTLHPSNGCWLHGRPTTTPPDAVPCGDGDSCVTGGSSRFPLPPTPPPPPPPVPPPPPPPPPVISALAKPTRAHLRFHEDNVGAIAHFGMQTFVSPADRKCPNVWPASNFNPVDLDTDNWVAAAAAWGAKYFVLVADHFSGFNLWPTAQHNYSVAGSPWRNGTGALPHAGLVENRYNIRPAVYYSVHENWYKGVCSFNLSNTTAQRAYEDMAIAQLSELAEKYGPDLAELWFDAGVRQGTDFVNRVNQWAKTTLPTTATCHSCQNLPDVSAVSWMGNENTVMPYPVWNANDGDCSHNGLGSHGYGIPDGTRWCPAHCDAVLRRHFWFWNNENYNETTNLNTAPDLLSMHLTSVGRGCNMILDMSPTPTGLLEKIDSATYAAFGTGLQSLYTESIVGNVTGVAGVNTISWEAGSGGSVDRGALELREDLTTGQAVLNYSVEYCSTAPCSGAFAPLALLNGPCQTIGNRRIQFWHNTTVASLRITVSTLQLQSGPAPPNLRSLAVFDWSSASLNPLLEKILTVQ